MTPSANLTRMSIELVPLLLVLLASATRQGSYSLLFFSLVIPIFLCFNAFFSSSPTTTEFHEYDSKKDLIKKLMKNAPVRAKDTARTELKCTESAI